jgi:Zn finger protein HypA/HybF involved in hydrogenase expression
MKIYDCKCKKCKAEFQAAMESAQEKLECPACNSTDIDLKETDLEFGCGGSCGTCGGCQ